MTIERKAGISTIELLMGSIEQQIRLKKEGTISLNSQGDSKLPVKQLEMDSPEIVGYCGTIILVVAALTILYDAANNGHSVYHHRQVKEIDLKTEELNINELLSIRDTCLVSG